jgi:C4-dicarboxylate-specific signal transduction histidine kinase
MAGAVQVSKRSIIEREKAQAELARANRVATVGQLTASIAHEVSQPLAGVILNGHAALHWLANETPDLEEGRGAIERVIKDGKRAGDVIGRARKLMVKEEAQRKDSLDINEVVREVIVLTRSEVLSQPRRRGGAGVDDQHRP